MVQVKPIVSQIVLAAALVVSPAVATPAGVRALDAWRALPLAFAVNRGQADPAVRFTAQGDGASYFVTAGAETVVALGAGRALRLSLLGAAPRPAAAGEGELAGRFNYLQGRDPRRWRRGVPAYSRVRCRGVYPGIDLVVHGAGRRLEQDFVVAPGADPGAIRFAVRGADAVTAGAGDRAGDPGDLILTAGGERARLGRPVAYQVRGGVRRAVASRFLPLGRGAFGFALGAYDRSRPLVIDPVIVPVTSTSTHLGGRGDDRAYAVALDADGNVYVTGETDSTGFPPVDRLDSVVPEIDVFVVKLDWRGRRMLYTTIFGGSFADSGRAIAVDARGQAHVAGQTFSPDLPAGPGDPPAPPAAAPIAHGTGFLVKLDDSGRRVLFSRFLGRDRDAALATGVAVDAAGRAYVVGRAGQKTPSPVYAAFAAGGSPLAWGLGAGPLCRQEAGPDVPVAVAVDGAGYAIVAGRTADRHLFVSRLTPASRRVYTACFRGEGADLAAAVAADAAGNAYVAGVTSSRHFPTFQPLQKTLAGATDAFVLKLGPRGGTVFSTFLGGEGDDEALGIAVDGAGRVAVTGATSSLGFPLARPFPQGCDPRDGGCRFVVSLAGGGAPLLYSLLLGDSSTHLAPGGVAGGAGEGRGASIAAQPQGGVFVAGSTTSPEFPSIAAEQPGAGGASDAYLVKIDRSGPVCGHARVTPPLLWPPDGRLVPVRILDVADTAGGPVAIAITRIAQDEPAGSTPSASRTSDGGALLKAQRDPLGDGRVYHIFFTATGQEGATCDGELTVCVPRGLGSGRTCGDGGRLYYSETAG